MRDGHVVTLPAVNQHGVLEGLITCETLGFEDYPCEMTMIRWRLSPPKLFSLKAVSNLE